MSDAVRVKICGLTRPGDVDAVARAGAAYAGLVFFPQSPRALTPDRAREVALAAPSGLARVALFVDADDAAIEAVLESVPIDLLQLHGSESPERVDEVRSRFGLPVIKALGVAGEGDLAALAEHGRAADMLLVDAKPAPGAARPGGNGLAFDWRLIAGRRWPVPWILAGGLTPENVAEAIRLTGARQVDVSSGVEMAPGIKDSDRIAAFTRAVRRTDAAVD
jgi:phosphoribosylanthranilate isomerase